MVLFGKHALNTLVSRRMGAETLAARPRGARGRAARCEAWAQARASTLSSCCTMLPYVSVNTSALILSIFWNACSPIRVKFLLLPAILCALPSPRQAR